MNLFKNQLKYNNFFNLSPRSEHTRILDKKIQNLNTTDIELYSSRDEINKIVNSKKTSLNVDINSIKTALNKKNLILSKLLLSNNISNFHNFSSSFDFVILKNNFTNYFSLGNKHLPISIYKNLMFKLNKKINKIEKNTDSFNRFNLRHYINLMTEFEYNLSNSHYNFYKFNKTNKYLFNIYKSINNIKYI